MKEQNQKKLVALLVGVGSSSSSTSPSPAPVKVTETETVCAATGVGIGVGIGVGSRDHVTDDDFGPEATEKMKKVLQVFSSSSSTSFCVGLCLKDSSDCDGASL